METQELAAPAVKEKKIRAKAAKLICETAAELKPSARTITKVITKATEIFDWKELIPAKFVDISSNWLTTNGIDPNGVTDSNKEELKEKCGEENLIIKLGGFKHLAALRGIKSIKYDMTGADKAKHVTSICYLNLDEVIFKTESGEEIFFPEIQASGIANATSENTSYPFNMYLESMAENRSFIRAVKAAFNINVLGAEEVQAPPAQTVSILSEEGTTTPQESLRALVSGRSKTFSDLKENLRKKKWEGFDSDWNDFNDVPAEQCFLIIDSIITKKAE
jgi:hypothetical protein